MTYEFAIVVQPEPGQYRTVIDYGNSEAEVRTRYPLPVSCTKLRAVVDWSRGTFTLEEAAEYIRSSPSGMHKLRAEGRLSWKLEGGRPKFTKAQLDKFLAREAA